MALIFTFHILTQPLKRHTGKLQLINSRGTETRSGILLSGTPVGREFPVDWLASELPQILHPRGPEGSKGWAVRLSSEGGSVGWRETPAREEAGDKQLPTYQLLTVDESLVSGASGYSSVKNRVAIAPRHKST